MPATKRAHTATMSTSSSSNSSTDSSSSQTLTLLSPLHPNVSHQHTSATATASTHPATVMELIGPYLIVHELLHLREVCRALNDITHQPAVWKGGFFDYNPGVPGVAVNAAGKLEFIWRYPFNVSAHEFLPVKLPYLDKISFYTFDWFAKAAKHPDCLKSLKAIEVVAGGFPSSGVDFFQAIRTLAVVNEHQLPLTKLVLEEIKLALTLPSLLTEVEALKELHLNACSWNTKQELIDLVMGLNKQVAVHMRVQDGTDKSLVQQILTVGKIAHELTSLQLAIVGSPALFNRYADMPLSHAPADSKLRSLHVGLKRLPGHYVVEDKVYSLAAKSQPLFLQCIEQLLQHHPNLVELQLTPPSPVTMPHSLYQALVNLEQLQKLQLENVTTKGFDMSILPISTKP